MSETSLLERRFPQSRCRFSLAIPAQRLSIGFCPWVERQTTFPNQSYDEWIRMYGPWPCLKNYPLKSWYASTFFDIVFLKALQIKIQRDWTTHHHIILNYTLFHIKMKQSTNKLDISKIIFLRKCDIWENTWQMECEDAKDFVWERKRATVSHWINSKGNRKVHPTWHTASTHRGTVHLEVR